MRGARNLAMASMKSTGCYTAYIQACIELLHLVLLVEILYKFNFEN